MLGTGPLRFELTAEQSKPGESRVPCEEFCPELVISSDGGAFSVEWLGFQGTAKLKGGLDCRTGQFRAELFDGRYSTIPGAAPADMPFGGGDLSGTFGGEFQRADVPAIQGDFMARGIVGASGSFSVQRQP